MRGKGLAPRQNQQAFRSEARQIQGLGEGQAENTGGSLGREEQRPAAVLLGSPGDQ